MVALGKRLPDRWAVDHWRLPAVPVLSHGSLVLEGTAAHHRENSHLLESSYLGGDV